MMAAEVIENLLVAALEKSILYWGSAAYTTFAPSHPGVAYYRAPLTGGSIIVVQDEPYDDGPAARTIDKAAIDRAVAIMARDYPAHYRNAINGNDADATADLFVQLCCFGRLVYS